MIANRVLTGCHGQLTIGQYLKSSAQIKLGVGVYESMVSSIIIDMISDQNYDQLLYHI